MKHTRKLASLLLALVMVLSLATTAFAADGDVQALSEETGSITIKDNTNVSVAGKTFNAYKILDVTEYSTGTDGNHAVYTVPAAMKDFYKDRYKISDDVGDFDYEVVDRISKEQDMFAFATAALAAAKTAGITPGTATANDSANEVTINNLPLGYYVVEDAGTKTPISALILDTTNPDVEVKIKADKPSIDKKIDGTNDTDDATTGDVENNNAAIGDTVPYKVTSKVPDMTGYEKYYFVVNDTLSKGLTFNNDVAITIGDKTLVKDTDYTVTITPNTDGTTSVKIVFKNFIQYKDQTNAAITITYSATVNKDAVIGEAGNPNKVKLIYSNNPNVKDDGKPENPDEPDENSPVGETPEEVTRTFVTELEIIKVDENGNRLTGAEFKLEGTRLNTVLVTKDVFTESTDGTYWKLTDGTYTTQDPNAEGMDQSKYESTTTKYAKTTQSSTITKAENVTYIGTVGSDGVLKFTGLSAGTYTITEIKAPEGFNLLQSPITVTIGFTAPADATNNCTWTYTWSTGTGITGNSNQVTIVNNSGTELPSTGGIGTTIFYVLGSILVIGAVVLLVTKKRMSTQD